ncbi:MAG: Gfo/Idh/MocA family oxidoreductase [Bacteroidales bacterium]
MAQSRRKFLTTGLSLAAGAGLAGLIPSGMGLTSCSTRKNPGDRIRVALIGCRNMGFTNACSFIEQPDVDLVAICDIDKKIREDRMADIQKYAYDKKVVVPKMDQYEDFRKVLERKDIDAVIVATPDHWHALITIMACEAGKDVYVEKPAANSVFEADQMVNAAQRYNRVVQVGQWQRSGLHWLEMVDFIQSEKLGPVSYVDVWRYGGISVPKVPDAPVPAGVNYDMWLGPAPFRSFNPNRFHYNFRWHWDYAGGKMTDWGVHLLDMAMWALKLKQPDTITATGGNIAFPNDDMETPDTLTVEYQFDQVMVVWQNNFALQTNEFGFDHGLAFHGTNGVLRANRNYWEVIPAQVNGIPVTEPVPRNVNAGNDLRLHIRNFLDAIKTRNFETAANIKIGRDVARLAHLGNIAYRTGLTLNWNAETGSFNEQAANHYLKPLYRKPWEINKIT